MEKTERKKSSKQRLIFLITTAVLLIIIFIMGVGLIKFSRINRYSKNITLGNNYFMNSYDDFSDDELQKSDTIEEIQGNYAAEIISHEDAAIHQFYEMYECGFIDDYTLNQILEEADMHGIEDAVKFANQLFGMDVFSHNSYGYMINVPYISQVGILPNGCEAVSAVMLLRYNGYTIDPVDFADNYLDKGEVYIKWGCRYGPNPKQQYAGDPKSEKGGWGCFSPVIIKALNKYLNGKMFAKNLTGLPIEEIVQQYIPENIPVAIWCTQGMQEIDRLYQWQSYDKSETFLYPVHQHCMVLMGFDSEYYYFNDPLSDEQQVKYKKSDVAASFNSMGRQAVALIPISQQ